MTNGTSPPTSIPQNDPSGFCFNIDQRNIARKRSLFQCDIGAVQTREVVFVVANPAALNSCEQHILTRLRFRADASDRHRWVR